VQLPRLLEPQGITAYVARSAQEAVELAEREEFHAAVIDLSTPLGRPQVDVASTRVRVRIETGFPTDPSMPAGMWMLELFRRLPHKPPMVVIQSPAFSRREIDRLMHEALRLGAFSVLPKPVNLNQLLEAFRRLIERQYRGQWPARQGGTER